LVLAVCPGFAPVFAPVDSYFPHLSLILTTGGQVTSARCSNHAAEIYEPVAEEKPPEKRRKTSDSNTLDENGQVLEESPAENEPTKPLQGFFMPIAEACVIIVEIVGG